MPPRRSIVVQEGSFHREPVQPLMRRIVFLTRLVKVEPELLGDQAMIPAEVIDHILGWRCIAPPGHSAQQVPYSRSTDPALDHNGRQPAGHWILSSLAVLEAAMAAIMHRGPEGSVFEIVIAPEIGPCIEQSALPQAPRLDG